MPSNPPAERPGVFAAIWLASLALATAVVAALLVSWDEQAWTYPAGPPDLAGAQIVFVGSSLTRFALPGKAPETGVLGDGRSCALLAQPGISGQLTTWLLEHAVESGAGTVFVEINPFAQDRMPLNEPALLYPLVRGLREAGDRMAKAVRALAVPGQRARAARRQGPHDRLRCGAPSNVGGYLDADRLARRDQARLVAIEPADHGALHRALDRARERGVEVIFFAPPQPRSAVEAMGSTEYAALQAHLASTAARFGAPLWAPPGPWPDELFMDLQGHAAEAGRIRFRDELARWYAGRR